MSSFAFYVPLRKRNYFRIKSRYALEAHCTLLRAAHCRVGNISFMRFIIKASFKFSVPFHPITPHTAYNIRSTNGIASERDLSNKFFNFPQNLLITLSRFLLHKTVIHIKTSFMYEFISNMKFSCLLITDINFRNHDK